MTLQNKIWNHEYIDFARLKPLDKVTKEDDHCMELVSRGGQTFFVPVSDRETTGITSFSKWEQAFRIYSNLYTKRYPNKASELIQYNHIIYTASLTFSWDNVYQYDKEFRMHLSQYPLRSWAVILQQAWSICLKDRIKHEDFHSHNGSGRKFKKEACKRFNRGQCTAGRNCKYDHRCTVPTCGKFGHGAHICRKRNNGNSGDSSITSHLTLGGNQTNQGTKWMVDGHELD